MGSKKGEKITVTGEEYCEIVGDLVKEYRNRIISDDDIFLTLDLNKEIKNASKFELELCVILTVIAMRLFGIKHTNDKIQGFVSMNVLARVGKTVFNFKSKEQEQFENLYFEKVEVFKQIAPTGKSSFEIRSSWLGFARYLVSLFSDKEEEDNKELIQKLSTYIVEFADIMGMFFASSRTKVSAAWAGKYEFVITK